MDKIKLLVIDDRTFSAAVDIHTDSEERPCNDPVTAIDHAIAETPTSPSLSETCPGG